MRISRTSILTTLLLLCLLSDSIYASESKFNYLLIDSTMESSKRVGCLNLLLSQHMQDSSKQWSPHSLKLKSPYMAVFYSVIPGVLVRGSGHFNAGKGGTGTTLLGLEAAGALLLYFGSLSAFQGSSHQNDTDAMGYIGLALFAGSWVYDIVGSPIIRHRQTAARVKTYLRMALLM
jgi:hypothetical protein